ncbi:hypothetical protein [Microscilla marina]|uniref:Uncharacterized protein n=1 Tax=Microscilla marina ATCC 23134 TaxID=313606 RepID=A1ZL84_MICM2|nr:hypothetical protein [Microscilla marina]EAY29050.1 hypothetical protein M23134_00205 [Microscilla marina ATCC 23134]
MKKLLTLLALFSIQIIFVTQKAAAQCAMCQATVESSMSEGAGIGAGLNAGILYLAAFPYLVLGGIAYFWYKHSKKRRDAKRIQISGNYSV